MFLADSTLYELECKFVRYKQEQEWHKIKNISIDVFVLALPIFIGLFYLLEIQVLSWRFVALLIASVAVYWRIYMENVQLFIARLEQFIFTDLLLTAHAGGYEIQLDHSTCTLKASRLSPLPANHA